MQNMTLLTFCTNKKYKQLDSLLQKQVRMHVLIKVYARVQLYLVNLCNYFHVTLIYASKIQVRMHVLIKVYVFYFLKIH
jgi:hypothetical protein